MLDTINVSVDINTNKVDVVSDDEAEVFDAEKIDNCDSIAEYLAKIITSKHNQHVVLRIIGAAGMGKSWAAVSLAIEVSRIVAIVKGGKPDDYFNFKKCLAVIEKSEIKRVMTDPGEYNILLLDDIGVGWNARKYKDDFNIFLNNIIQTFRPKHNLVIMTLQSSFLIDKVPRSLAHYEIEMESANFEEGYTIAKVNRVVMKHKIGKLYYPYIFINGMKYVRHLFESPPIEQMEEYESIRTERLKHINSEDDEEKEEKKKETLTKEKFLTPYIISLNEEGVKQCEIADKLGISSTLVSNVLRKAYLS